MGVTTTVSVVIVNYNGRALLDELFASLARQTCPADEVILVDNASTDGSAGWVRAHYPWVRVVASPANVGFAEGNNLGVVAARGEYIALLNSDTTVDERWLTELVRTLDGDARAGAAVSKVYLAARERTLDCVGARFNNLGHYWGRGVGQSDRGQFDEGGEVPGATAVAMLLRRAALGGAPLFDRRLFMYYEEFDLTLRLRGAGWTIVAAPASIVHHKRSQAVKGASKRPLLFHQFHANRNRVKLLAKYYPLGVLLRSLPLIGLSLAYWNAAFLRWGGPRLFLRAVGAQLRFAFEGAGERLRGGGIPAETVLPWMTQQRLRDVLALRREFGEYVE